MVPAAVGGAASLRKGAGSLFQQYLPERYVPVPARPPLVSGLKTTSSVPLSLAITSHIMNLFGLRFIFLLETVVHLS